MPERTQIIGQRRRLRPFSPSQVTSMATSNYDITECEGVSELSAHYQPLKKEIEAILLRL